MILTTYKVRNTLGRGHYLKILKRLGQVVSWIRRMIRKLYTNGRMFTKNLSDQSYRRDVTKRRLKVQGWGFTKAVILTLLCGAGLLGLGIFGSQLWDAISFWLGIAIQIPYNLVRPFTLLDAKEFVTFIFAEGFFVLNAFIFRWLFFRNRDLRGPRIIIQGGSIYAENSGVRVFCASVSNTGDSAARSCQARITLDDIEQRDMEGLPSVNTTFNLQNFTSSIKTDLRWKKDNHKEMTIRSEDDAELEILRFVPENDGVPAHFDVPSESGWEPLSASLNLSTLYIRIKVVPLNGRPSKYTYWTERHKGEWTLGAFR